MISKILSLLKSVYVNIRLCSIKDAIKLPILVKWNCRLISLKGRVVFVNGSSFGLLKIGFSSVGIIDPLFQRSLLEINGLVKIGGGYFGSGSRICVMPSGILEIGMRFQNSANITIICEESVKIGDDVLTSWETLIMDTDFHQYVIIDNESKSVMKKPVVIGNHCWLGVRSVILKGSILADGCIVAANTLIAGNYEEKFCIIGGRPGRIIKRGCEKVSE